jgi:two-component system cell cycle sensor histidine kinase/response regulator CckA
MPQDFFATRIEDLRRAEYGSRGETLIRYIIMAGAIALLMLVLDRKIVMAWGALYFLLELSVALTVHVDALGTTRLRYGMALVFYALSGLCFMSLPLYLIHIDQSLALNFAGAAGLVELLLYTLQRPQREPGLMAADCVQVVLMTVGLLVVLQPRLNTWMDSAIVLFIALALLGYYVASLITSWRQQRSLREAQHRYANAQKARAMGQFVGGVAHDFNNQLTAIMGNLDLFEQMTTAEERMTALRESRAAAERAAMTVQQLLASSGRTRLSPRCVEMEQFLFDLGDLLTDLLDPGMIVEVVPLQEPLRGFVDRDMLETSAIQLCLNAQDATHAQGTLRLSVERRRTALKSTALPRQPAAESSMSAVALVIDDNGPGVSLDALHLLAEPFYTTKPTSEGRGLGLSAVAGFAIQSGGALMFETALSDGLRAIIVLPEAHQTDQ